MLVTNSYFHTTATNHLKNVDKNVVQLYTMSYICTFAPKRCNALTCVVLHDLVCTGLKFVKIYVNFHKLHV